MFNKLRTLITSYPRLPGNFRHLRMELDALKSSLEVPQQLIDDFFKWKADHPIPTSPLVTVIVATYNRPRTLMERCIRSILNQTYTNLELIIVGDRCTEETKRVIATINDPRATFVNLTERAEYPSSKELKWMVAGAPAMNMALSMAQGDYIAHLDDDDEYVYDRLEKLVKFAISHQCDFVWHPFWWERRPGRWAVNRAIEIAHGQVTNGSVFYRHWFKKISYNVEAFRLREPADWNRYRRIKYIGPLSMRYPEPLMRHYREQTIITGNP